MDRKKMAEAVEILAQELADAYNDFCLEKSKEDKDLEKEAARVINKLDEVKGFCKWLNDNYLLEEYATWVSRALIIKAKLLEAGE